MMRIHDLERGIRLGCLKLWPKDARHCRMQPGHYCAKSKYVRRDEECT
jgi:hypothetical protein